MKKILHGNHAKVEHPEDLIPVYQTMLITNYVRSKRQNQQPLYLRSQDVEMAKRDVDERQL